MANATVALPVVHWDTPNITFLIRNGKCLMFLSAQMVFLGELGPCLTFPLQALRSGQL